MMNSAPASTGIPVAVFGGSGATGNALLSRIAREGLAVRVLARKSGSIIAQAGRLEVVEGVLSDAGDVLVTLQGCSVAICVFGLRPP